MLKLIKTTVLDASAASVTIDNIPQQFKTLKLVVSARSTYSGASRSIALYFNGSTTAVYSYRYLYGNGSAAGSGNYATQDDIWVSEVPAATATGSTFGNVEIHIPNYAGSTNKPVSADSVMENNATLSYQHLFAGLRENTSAITSITFRTQGGGTGSFDAGSTFYLYGIG